MVIGSGTYPINFIRSAYSYRLICSPSTIPVDGTGVLKGGVASLPVTVSVSKATDNIPSAAVTDEDGLSIAVTKVTNTGGRVTVIAATDGRLTTEMPTKTFDIAGNGLNVVASYEVVLYKLNENLEKVPVDNVGIPVVADGKGIVSANVYYYQLQLPLTYKPDSKKASENPPQWPPTDPTVWTATTVDGLGLLARQSWIFSAVKVTYTTGEVVMTGIQLLGNGIDYATIVEVYANGDSQTTTPRYSSFVEAASFVPEKGKWLWTASKTTYLNGSTAYYLNPVCVGYIGNDGTAVVGKDAELYDLTVSPTTIHCNADGVVLNADRTIRVTAAHYVGNVAKDITADDGLYLSMTMLTEAGESKTLVSRYQLTGAAYTHTPLEAITTTATVINVTLERLAGGTYTVMRTTDVAITRDGRSGDRGATGAMTYCAGIYDPNADYIATPTAHPYVIVEDAGVVGRFRLDDETDVWNGNGSLYPSDDAQRWSMITDLKEVFASVAFIEFGKLASAIFSGDYMISQTGTDCYADDDLTRIIRKKGATNYKDFNVDDPEGTSTSGWTTNGSDRTHKFVPNIYMNFLTGHTVFNDIEARGKVNGESVRHSIANYSISPGGSIDAQIEEAGGVDMVIVDVFGNAGAASTLHIVAPSMANKGKQITFSVNYRGYVAPIQAIHDVDLEIFYDSYAQLSQAMSGLILSDGTDQYSKVTIVSDGSYWRIIDKIHT